MENPTRSLTPAFDVTRIDDLAFAEVKNDSGEHEILRLDIYQPGGAPSGPRPAIFWFHGGGFRPGNDKRQVYIPLFAQAFATRGFVGIAPDYRVREEPDEDPEGTLADIVSDGRQAMAWVSAHAAEYGIDLGRILLAGGSAGGMLVLNLVHTSTAPLEGVLGVIDLWGTPAGPWRRYERIRPDSPATFIVHGTGDALVPYENSHKFSAELEQAGIRHTLLTIPDAPHTPLMHSEQIIAAIAVFLKETGLMKDVASKTGI